MSHLKHPLLVNTINLNNYCKIYDDITTFFKQHDSRVPPLPNMVHTSIQNSRSDLLHLLRKLFPYRSVVIINFSTRISFLILKYKLDIITLHNLSIVLLWNLHCTCWNNITVIYKIVKPSSKKFHRMNLTSYDTETKCLWSNVTPFK